MSSAIYFNLDTANILFLGKRLKIQQAISPFLTIFPSAICLNLDTANILLSGKSLKIQICSGFFDIQETEKE